MEIFRLKAKVVYSPPQKNKILSNIALDGMGPCSEVVCEGVHCTIGRGFTSRCRNFSKIKGHGSPRLTQTKRGRRRVPASLVLLDAREIFTIYEK